MRGASLDDLHDSTGIPSWGDGRHVRHALATVKALSGFCEPVGSHRIIVFLCSVDLDDDIGAKGGRRTA